MIRWREELAPFIAIFGATERLSGHPNPVLSFKCGISLGLHKGQPTSIRFAAPPVSVNPLSQSRRDLRGQFFWQRRNAAALESSTNDSGDLAFLKVEDWVRERGREHFAGYIHDPVKRLGDYALRGFCYTSEGELSVLFFMLCGQPNRRAQTSSLSASSTVFLNGLR